MEAKHNFLASGGNTFNIALYDNSASFTAATTAYTSSNEISGTNYSAKGGALTNVNPTTSSTTAFTDFADEVFSNVTISSVRGAMIFNDTASGDPSVCILDFGADKSSTAGTFSILFPTPTATGAIIRIA